LDLLIPAALDAGLWALAAALAAAAVWWTLPRPAAVDWELYFKLALVTLARGEVEAEGGDADAWLARGRRLVWYHPGARLLEAKLADPAGFAVPAPARAGERALLEALERLPTPEARLEHTFGPAGGGEGSLYDDPALLGDDFAAARALGARADWGAVATWSAEAIEGLRRKNQRTRWALMGAPPGVLEAVEEALGEGRAASLDAALDGEALAEALAALVPALADRAVVVATGDAAGRLARCLHAEPGLRDRVLAVVGLHPALGPHAAWLEAHFGHAEMDTEIARATPWYHLGFIAPDVSPPGEPGAPLAETRWPESAPPPTGRVALEVVDLGVLPGPMAAYPPRLLARALLVAVTARVG